MKGISIGGGKKWLYFEYILNVESIGFADRLDVACEGGQVWLHSV